MTLNYEERQQRRIAYREVINAKRKGLLVPQPCEVCGSEPTDAHHRWGYAEPLRVMWLCPRHHIDDHAEMRATRPFKPYVEPRHWTYSESTRTARAIEHIERLFGLLEDDKARCVALAALLRALPTEQAVA